MIDAAGEPCVAVVADGGLTVVFVAAGGPSVAVVAVGGLTVVFVAVSNGTRAPAARSTGWTLVFGRRFRQNGASMAARSFDAVCVESSSVLS